MKKQGRKGFQSSSVSRKAIRDTSSALRWSPIQELSPLLLKFSDETGTPQATPHFMKVLRPKKWKINEKSEL